MDGIENENFSSNLVDETFLERPIANLMPSDISEIIIPKIDFKSYLRDINQIWTDRSLVSEDKIKKGYVNPNRMNEIDNSQEMDISKRVRIPDDRQKKSIIREPRGLMQLGPTCVAYSLLNASIAIGLTLPDFHLRNLINGLVWSQSGMVIETLAKIVANWGDSSVSFQLLEFREMFVPNKSDFSINLKNNININTISDSIKKKDAVNPRHIKDLEVFIAKEDVVNPRHIQVKNMANLIAETLNLNSAIIFDTTAEDYWKYFLKADIGNSIYEPGHAMALVGFRIVDNYMDLQIVDSGIGAYYWIPIETFEKITPISTLLLMTNLSN